MFLARPRLSNRACAKGLFIVRLPVAVVIETGRAITRLGLAGGRVGLIRGPAAVYWMDMKRIGWRDID
jgi:hypothetical protein